MVKNLPGNLLFFFFVIMLGWAPAGRAEETEPKLRDVLVFKDGDRVQGRLIGERDGIVVFQSDRFGELKAPAGDVAVIRADKPAGPSPLPAVTPPAPMAAAAARRDKKAVEQAEAEKVSLWEHFSPAVLAADLRNYFGPWHGRLAFSTEVVSDTANRSNLSLEGKLKRKWKVDEVQLSGRYDFNKTNDLTTTDTIKGDGLWRHDFSKDRFVQYRPSLEWNRASFTLGKPSDYVLLQQEIGVGVSVLTRPVHKVRLGVSENLFDVWNTSSPAGHSARTTESAFAEIEQKIPWGMLLTDRGVYYYSLSARNEGWENRVELTKKFTETFSTAIREEVRHGNPDGKAQDYTRLKLLFGLDF